MRGPTAWRRAGVVGSREEVTRPLPAASGYGQSCLCQCCHCPSRALATLRPLHWAMCLALLSAGLVRTAVTQTAPIRFPGLPTIEELAEEAGVAVDHSLVRTEDGYLLRMYRLGNNTGPPVLVQHGLLNAADIWLTRGKDADLVYQLLADGYDIYLGNLRGNTFSKQHVRLSPTDAEFWDFSFHESGYYDLPVMVDRVLSMTGAERVLYVGHSLGTTVFFVMCSTRPEYNAKIQAAVMLAPVGYIPDKAEFSISFLRLLMTNRHTIWRSLSSAGWLEVLPRTASMIKAVHELCGYGAPTQDYCLDIFGILLGEHRANIDRKHFAYHFGFYGTGSSLKTFVHLGQVIANSEFEYLDLGPEANLKVYNSSRPPPYPLERISAPVALYWSYNDNFLSQTSIERMVSRLPNVVLNRPNPDPKFTHVDLFVGRNAQQVLYTDVRALINSYRRPS